MSCHVAGSYAVSEGHKLMYDKQALLDIREKMKNIKWRVPAVDEDVRQMVKRRKRGRKGGVRERCGRRGTRAALPTVMFGNVRSIRNKSDELEALVRYKYEYRESAMICLTETWLQDKDEDSTVKLTGFQIVRGDRQINSRKKMGGGVCLYVNDRWCKNTSVKEKYCDENIEYIVVSMRPFYLPREFPNVFVFVVYIPPDANYNGAIDKLLTCINLVEEKSPEAVKILLGDFNECNFKSYVPQYTQYVHCSTRKDKILDLLFCNVKNGYNIYKKPPLGSSDHNMLYCLPIYKQKIKSIKPTEIIINQWSNEVSETLKGCFECTDWSELCHSDNIDENVDVISSYINFCIQNVVPTKSVKVYPNNKPWVTKELKSLLNEKKRALTHNNKDVLKQVQKRLNKGIADCKFKYKKKVENMFKSRDPKNAWKGLNSLTGRKLKQALPEPEDPVVYAQELNNFYARFDVHNFQDECSAMIQTLKDRNDVKIIIKESDVINCLNSIKMGKTAGPDKICGRVLKDCKCQLAPVITQLFQSSLDQHCVPVLWKTSEIIPIPKINFPRVKNDLRPVALTAIIMKCFETMVKKILCPQVKKRSKKPKNNIYKKSWFSS